MIPVMLLTRYDSCRMAPLYPEAVAGLDPDSTILNSSTCCRSIVLAIAQQQWPLRRIIGRYRVAIRPNAHNSLMGTTYHDALQ